MADKGIFLQNVIAVIWDFDKTLSPHYMQRPVFEAFGVDEGTFWNEVRALPEYYRRAGVKIQEDTCYLGHLLAYVKYGKLPNLTNARLRELGAEILLFPGLPEFFERLHQIIREAPFAAGDLRLEHYVVSTGLDAMIRGSVIAPYIRDVWASVFIEEPARPGQNFGESPVSGPISQIAGFLDNTTKTRALFEINKGVNASPDISVNDVIPEQERRVPFKNMIYIADGPSDIPSFSVVRKHGGLAYAVYDRDSDEHYRQVLSLHETQRVNMFGPADYREDSETERWLRTQIRKIAERMMEERRRATESRVTRGPVHL